MGAKKQLIIHLTKMIIKRFEVNIEGKIIIRNYFLFCFFLIIKMRSTQSREIILVRPGITAIHADYTEGQE